MKQAYDLWEYIKEKSGVKTDLIFGEDKSLVEGSYVIDGNLIVHHSSSRNPAAIYAVARLSQELFAAKMLGETVNTIVLTPNEWKDLQVVYKPNLVRNNYVNTPINSMFFWWHHIPTEGSGGANFHRSWFLGLCLKYPQLTPPGVSAKETTKPDFSHPEFPEIIFKEWQLKGEPDIVSLFEIDGTEFDNIKKHIVTPDYCNPIEKERFEISIRNGMPGVFTIGSVIRAKSDGIRYPVTANINWARAIIPRDNENRMYNYTALYIQMYKSVQNYFDSQGANQVTFNVLAYSAYRCFPENLQVDLSRFHVYYAPTFRGNNITHDRMLHDIAEPIRWKKSGAKVIFRMNYPFEKKGNGKLIAEYLKAVQFHGIQAAPFYNENLQDYLEVFEINLFPVVFPDMPTI
jgi:hypothetical protein